MSGARAAHRLVTLLLAAPVALVALAVACNEPARPPADASPPPVASPAGTATPTHSPSPVPPPPGPVRLNHIQVVGTHNSYHVEPGDALLGVVRRYLPQLAATLQYTHVALARQLEEQSMRSLELDVFADPAGGLFADPAGRRVAGLPNPPSPLLLSPGFKVLHIQDLDTGTTCYTLMTCLHEVRTWSVTHPGHVPIVILIEAKDDPIPDLLGLGLVTPHLVGTAELDALDAEVRTVFEPGRLVTPDDVRGQRGTLEEAVLRDGWPEVAAARGKVMFVLINGGSIRDAYRAGRPSLEGRVMFTVSTPGQPDAAFIKRDDALTQAAAIRELVAAGYMVRTRADADTSEARSGETAMRTAALSSGAQVVSTDYPAPDARWATGYSVTLGNGLAARCNPVLAPVTCADDGLDLAR